MSLLRRTRTAAKMPSRVFASPYAPAEIRAHIVTRDQTSKIPKYTAWSKSTTTDLLGVTPNSRENIGLRCLVKVSSAGRQKTMSSGKSDACSIAPMSGTEGDGSSRSFARRCFPPTYKKPYTEAIPLRKIRLGASTCDSRNLVSSVRTSQTPSKDPAHPQ